MGFKRCQVLSSPTFVWTCEEDGWATIKTNSPKSQGWVESWLDEGKALLCDGNVARGWRQVEAPPHRPVLASVYVKEIQTEVA